MLSLKKRLKQIASHDIASLMRGASFVLVCRVFGAVSVLVTQILLARWMGAEQLGIYIYVFAWCTFLSTIAGLGLPSTSFRFIGKGLADSNGNLVMGFTRRGGEVILLASLMLVAIGFVFMTEYQDLILPNQLPVFLIALGAVPVFALIRWYSFVAQALSCFRLAFLPMLVIRPLLLLLAVSSIWYMGLFALSAETVMFSHFAIILVIIIVQFFLVRRTLKIRFPIITQTVNKTSFWLRTAIPMLMTAIFTKNFMELNFMIAGGFLSEDQLAFFNATFRIAFLVAFIINAMDAMTAPRVAQLHASGNIIELQRLVSRSTKIKFFFACIGASGLMLFGKPILALFGHDFVEGYPALIILALSQIIVAGFGAGVQLLNVSGYQVHCLYIFVSSAILLVGLHTILIPRFGLYGVAVAVVLVIFVQSWLVNELVVRKLKIFPSIISFRKH